MTFSEFLQLMHSYIGCDVTKQDYVLYITNLIIREPANDAEEKADDADSYNPLSGKSQNLLHKLSLCGYTLDWYSSRNSSVQKRIIYSREIDYFATEQQTECYDWFVDRFDKLKLALDTCDSH